MSDRDKTAVVASNDINTVDTNSGDDEKAIVSEHGTTLAVITPSGERSLVWKFDLRILPLLAAMYLFNSLDKSNLGNAKTAGLEVDLGLSGNQYNIILSVFFVPYVLTAPFLGILGKKYGPNRVLPCMMFVFGFLTLMVVTVKNFSGLMAIRWFLGMSESAFFPLVIYYQTTSVNPISLSSNMLLGEGNPRLVYPLTLFADSIAAENLPADWPSSTPRNPLHRLSPASLLSASSTSILVAWPTGATFSLSKVSPPWQPLEWPTGSCQPPLLKHLFSQKRRRRFRSIGCKSTALRL